MARDEARVWGRFSGLYDVFMKKDMPAYTEMIRRIKERLNLGSHVLEIATGTGILALGIANAAEQVEAIDLSPEMIGIAEKKAQRMGVSNVRFSVQDAYYLPYGADSFDIVIIANTLHVMPKPEKALNEIKRVLKAEGYLIAPTFVHAGNKKAAVLTQLMSLAGFRAYQKWTQQSFCRFINDNGFDIMESAMLKATFPHVYVVARKKTGNEVE